MLTGFSQRDGGRRALVGAAFGLLVVLVVWVAEALLGGHGPRQLHTTSVAIWVVDALPFVLGLAMLEAQPRVTEAVESGIVPPPQPPEVATPPEAPPPDPGGIPTPMAPLPRTATPRTAGPQGTPPTAPGREPHRAPSEPTPPPVPPRLAGVSHEPTPPPVPRRLAQGAPAEATAIPEGLRRRVLLVDGTAEASRLSGWLEDRSYRVVHVGDAASGSLAREAERPELAIVDGDAVGAEALVRELARHRVPVVVLGGASMSLPQRVVRTVRPVTAPRIGDALSSLAYIDEP